jgi:hypothetical protein
MTDDEVRALGYSRRDETGAWVPSRDPVATSLGAPATREIGTAPYSSRRGESREPATCGASLLVRNRRTGEARVVRTPCKRRTCPDCRPVHAASRVAGIPEHTSLYIIDAADWGARRKQLSRLRTRGQGGDYLRIGDRAVVTDAPIGTPISREAVATMIEKTPPNRGHVSSSKGWRPEAPGHYGDDVDVRVLRGGPSGMKRLNQTARELGHEPRVVDAAVTTFGIVTDDDFELLAEAGEAVTPAELALYRAQARHRRRPSGRALAGSVAV